MGTGWRGGESEGGLLRDIAFVGPGRTHTRYETVLSFVMYVSSSFTGNYESSSLSTTHLLVT